MAEASISRVMNRNGHNPSPKRIGAMNFSRTTTCQYKALTQSEALAERREGVSDLPASRLFR